MAEAAYAWGAMLSFLDECKAFLSVQPEYAFLAISLMVNVYLFRLYRQSNAAHLTTVVRWLPVAEKLSSLVVVLAEKARNGKPKEAS